MVEGGRCDGAKYRMWNVECGCGCGFVEIEKNCRTQIESIKKENSKFSKTIMDEILQTSEKIEALKITIYTLNNRLEESHVQDRSRNAPDVNLEDVKKIAFGI